MLVVAWTAGGAVAAGAAVSQSGLAGSTTVELVPSDTELTESGQQTFEIVVTDASGGVGAVDATVSTSSDAVRIQSATVAGDPGTSDVSVAEGGQSATVEAALMDTADSGRVVVAEVVVSGATQGEATLDVDVSALGDETGDPYTVTATLGASVDVLDETDTVSLDVTANRSTVAPGETVGFTVTRADTGVRVAATVTVGDQRVETGVDGVAAVQIDETTTDAGTVTAVANKSETSNTAFADDSVTVSVGESDDGERAGSTTVRLAPTTETVGVDETATFDLVVQRADGGVGAVDATVTVGDAARITNVTFTGDPGTQRLAVSDDGQTADLEAALLQTSGADRLTVATVTVVGVEAGQTTVDAQIDALGDEAGNAYDVTATPAATLDVTEDGSDTGDSADDDSADDDSTDDDSTDDDSTDDDSADDDSTDDDSADDDSADDDSVDDDSADDDETTNQTGETGTTTVVVAVDSLPDGFEKASLTIETADPETVASVTPALVSGSQTRVVERADGGTTTRVQLVDLSDGVGPADGSQTLVEISYAGDVRREELTLSVPTAQNDDGNAISTDRFSVSVTTGGVFAAPLPGAGTDTTPRDPDDDGRYEDVDGDGDVDFDDAIAIAFVPADELDSEQTAALDFDGDGDVDIDDAIALAFQ